MRKIWYVSMTWCFYWDMAIPMTTCRGSKQTEACRYYRPFDFCTFTLQDRAINNFYNKMRQQGGDKRGDSSLYE